MLTCTLKEPKKFIISKMDSKKFVTLLQEARQELEEVFNITPCQDNYRCYKDRCKSLW